MMIRVQALDQFLWSITIYLPKVKERMLAVKLALEEQRLDIADNILPQNLLPKLSHHFSLLNKEDATACEFQNITLTEGWMVVGESSLDDDLLDKQAGKSKKKKKQKTVNWVDRSPDDCLEELVKFCEAMLRNMDERLKQCVSPAAHSLGACLYIPLFLQHMQGESDRMSAAQKVDLDAQGKLQFREFFEYVCTLPHIKDIVLSDDQVMFLPELASTVYGKFKEAVFCVVWKNLGNLRSSWFPPVNSMSNRHCDLEISSFHIEHCPHELDDQYHFKYGNQVCVARFDEQRAFSTMYSSDELSECLGKEMCTVLDIANAMSGSEAVVESFYSVMKTQIQSGGQNNATLVERTIVDWSFPHPFQCEETIKEVAALYLNGDKEYGLSRHQVPVFVDERDRALRKYSHGSKVLDRHSKMEIKTFALSPKDKI